MEKEKEICGAVRGYFSTHKITMKMVADRLGVSSSAVTNQLAGKQFTSKMAKRYAEEFGFSEEYLLFGKGSLLGFAETNHEHMMLEVPAQFAETLSKMSATILSQQQTISLLVRGGSINEQPPHHCEG